MKYERIHHNELINRTLTSRSWENWRQQAPSNTINIVWSIVHMGWQFSWLGKLCPDWVSERIEPLPSRIPLWVLKHRGTTPSHNTKCILTQKAQSQAFINCFSRRDIGLHPTEMNLYFSVRSFSGVAQTWRNNLNKLNRISRVKWLIYNLKPTRRKSYGILWVKMLAFFQEIFIEWLSNKRKWWNYFMEFIWLPSNSTHLGALARQNTQPTFLRRSLAFI